MTVQPRRINDEHITTTTTTDPVAIDFDRKLLRDIRSRAEGSGRTLSDFVNDAIRLAIDAEYVDDGTTIATGSDLALIPPVSGGSDLGMVR